MSIFLSLLFLSLLLLLLFVSFLLVPFFVSSFYIRFLRFYFFPHLRSSFFLFRFYFIPWETFGKRPAEACAKYTTSKISFQSMPPMATSNDKFMKKK